ncbi:hypothetical protein [Neisseria sp. Ec49-e6-T10]|uniref:hypothetical protein n=1 Tax=Neisseria sp. Ec49-e6-T10 TaxID=3140744 RepID=UPI003EB95194
MDHHNPYLKPEANLRKPHHLHDQNDVALWNPNAACNWCLLFSPIFGAYLHMLNWRALGMPEKEKESLIWFWVSIVSAVVAIFTPINTAFIVLIVWYFASARSQVKYVREHCGDSYERKPWGVPLLCATGVFVAVVILCVFLELVLN